MNSYKPEIEQKLNEVIDSLEELLLEAFSMVIMRLQMYYDPSKFSREHPNSSLDDSRHPY
jgi:hypothetical protein